MSEKSSSMIQNEADQAMHEFTKNAQSRDNPFEKVIVKKVFDGEEIDVVTRLQPISAGFTTDYYAPFEPGTSIVENLIYERDVAVILRDGRIMYTDIYRPQGMANVPVIIAWTPYGKRHWYGQGIAPGLHQAMGVPAGTISKLPAFEGPDPTYWCSKGYAVANADAPGTGYSEGDNTIWTAQGGRDGYDFIEWLATQKWCNGKIGMLGNSGLSMSQWYIAAEQPPHLAAIAPWEGTSDIYREWIAPGGIPHLGFPQLIYGDMRGPGKTEDVVEMILKFPMMNGYWEDKNAKVENITIPTYITAGYGHPYHLRASVGNFGRIKSKRKWLRLHREFEWPDFNNPTNIADVTLFFDRYLKNINNGWEMTPKVRVEVTDAYEYDFVSNRPENEFPLKRTKYTKYYLNANDFTLSKNPIDAESSVSYDAQSGEAVFNICFNEDTELTGYSKLRVWVEADGSNDADMFAQVRKLDKDGNQIPVSIFGEPDPGFVGKLRASHRELDLQKSKEYCPYHTHRNEQLLNLGEIVPLDIEIWPNSRIWHKGEQLQISISGRLIRDEEWFLPVGHETRNIGRHIIHTGGKYDSYFLAPVIPPKYTSGEYVYR